MAVKPEGGSVPLYVHTISRILREMRMSQQATGAQFDYQKFREEILAAKLSPAQLAPLHQRLAMLESFMPHVGNMRKGKDKKRPEVTIWENQVGESCIVFCDRTDADIAWLTDNSRSLLPLRFARDCLLVVQHMLKLVS